MGMPFRCPTCGSLFYDQFIARRAGGKSQRTELHFCLGCTTVFLEPELYTEAPEFKKTAPTKLPDMHSDQATLQREMAHRYWAARAKRDKGGVPQQSAAVFKFRSIMERHY